MHTEHLHRNLSPQAYARLLDELRHMAERERHQAVQAVFLTWPHPLIQRAKRALRSITHAHPLKA